MRVIGVAGWSGAGKTTLIAKLIPELNRRGLAVSTLKHAHRAFEIDQPGKDSFEHRRAGASEVLVASSKRWALVHELREEAEPSLSMLLQRLSPVDLVLVEGFKSCAHPKIEVYRAANGQPLLFGDLANVRAIAADVGVDAPIPVIDLNDAKAVADEALAAALPLAEVVALLERTPAKRLSPAGADRP